MAQPCPACEHVAIAAIITPKSTDSSSSTRHADLPPSSRNVFFSVSLAATMIALPTGVEPVNVIMSTFGSVVITTPVSTLLDVSTLTTPAGMSVFSAISLPRASVISGVSGAPLSTTVQPAASAGASLARLSWVG